MDFVTVITKILIVFFYLKILIVLTIALKPLSDSISRNESALSRADKVAPDST